MMPGSRDAGWNRLSAAYQNKTGRPSYDRWWGSISSVSASEIAATGPATVEATILYNFADGSRRRERHRYTLVNQNGAWLIDASTVLSSNPA
jgi:hypothetical protein